MDFERISDFLPDGFGGGGITELPGLKDMFDYSSPFYRYIRHVKTELPPGVDIVAMLRARLRALWEQAGVKQMADFVLVRPGDRRIRFGDSDSARSVDNPIAYDAWYLFYAGNVILNSKPDAYSNEEWIEEVLEKRLESYIETVGSDKLLKPLRQPKPAEAKTFPSGGAIANGFTGMAPSETIGSDVRTDWQYAIKEARFEVMVKPVGGTGFYPVTSPKPWSIVDEPHWPPKSGPHDASVHPPEPVYGLKEPDDDPYVGYIAFPVGPMGVMWRVSLVAESSLSGNGARNVHPADYESAVIEGGQLLPPFDLRRSNAPGENLMSKGYLIDDKSVVEYPAEPFETVDNPDLHGWLRYWIRGDNQAFWPGEFVGLLCRPWPLHCWWFQESAPLIYAGNWIETEFYTSGVVKCVLEMWTEPDSDPPSIGKTDESGYYKAEDWDFRAGAKLYVVWVKNEEIIVSSSDFLEYDVGDRVGLLKCVRDGSETAHTCAVGAVDAISGTSDKFSWESLKWFRFEKKNSRDEEMFTKEWVIVPVDFFPDVSGMGGA